MPFFLFWPQKLRPIRNCYVVSLLLLRSLAGWKKGRFNKKKETFSFYNANLGRRRFGGAAASFSSVGRAPLSDWTRLAKWAILLNITARHISIKKKTEGKIEPKKTQAALLASPCIIRAPFFFFFPYRLWSSNNKTISALGLCLHLAWSQHEEKTSQNKLSFMVGFYKIFDRQHLEIFSNLF